MDFPGDGVHRLSSRQADVLLGTFSLSDDVLTVARGGGMSASRSWITFSEDWFMQITEHVYSKKMQFQANTPFGILTRHAFVFVIDGSKKSCLVDAGLAPMKQEIIDFVTACGKGKDDIGEILITHSHSDHIGALKSLKAYYGCPVAAGAANIVWIEDTEKQLRERPVPRFNEFVEGSVKIERKLYDGDVIDLGDGIVVAYAVPGHDKGQMAFFYQPDGVLLSADSIPVPGDMPIYDDVEAQVGSLRKMRAIDGVNTLLMSWADPIEGEGNVHQALDDAIAYMRTVQRLTDEGRERFGQDQVEDVARYVHDGLSLPPQEFTAMFVATVKAHLACRNPDSVLA